MTRERAMRKSVSGLAALWIFATVAFAAEPPPAGSPPAAADNQAATTTAEEAKPPAAPENQESKAKQPPVYISMDFTDVDLPVLVKFISEQTRKNFIFDEKLQGKITIISPRKITADEAYNVFLSVLQVKGFTTVEQGNTIKIIALRDAKQESLPTSKGAESAPASEFIIRLIPLQYVDTAEVVTLLTPIISKDALLTSFPASNTLMLIDSRANIDRILKILAVIDVEGTSATLRIYPLKYASAAEVARTLDGLYQEAPPTGAAGARRGRLGKARGGASKFIPDSRTNSLIVLTSADMQSDIADLLSKLDIPAPENTGKINVYYLENSDAEEVAKVLSNLSERRAGPAQAAPGAAPGTVKGIISAELEGGVRITADKSTNSLIIIASVNDYQTLVDVIKKLDIRRRQVYVEALIMEITLNKGRDVGVEFRGTAETRNQGAVLGGTNFDFKGNINDLFGALATGNPLLFSGTGLIAGGIAGKVTLPDGTQVPAITAILRAAQTRDNINILSSPHLLTLDNKEAEIIVGQNVPFITSQAQNTTNLANIINTVERKDIGITLRMTPHIHESDFVNLDIYQESSAILGTSILNVNQVGPTTTKRSAKTSVLVRNEDTVVLGGMMQDTTSVSEQQVPLLGDIPLLGNLFKFKSVSRQKTNLLIFLTPHIIKQAQDIARVTTDQQKKMDAFIEENRGEVEKILPEKKAK